MRVGYIERMNNEIHNVNGTAPAYHYYYFHSITICITITTTITITIAITITISITITIIITFSTLSIIIQCIIFSSNISNVSCIRICRCTCNMNDRGMDKTVFLL